MFHILASVLALGQLKIEANEEDAAYITNPEAAQKVGVRPQKIIIIIIFRFYIAPNTLILDVSKRFTDVLLPWSSDSGLPAHNVCRFSNPWGAFRPVAIVQAHT